MLKFMKELQEVRRRWTATPRDARPTPRPDRGRVPPRRSFLGTSFVDDFPNATEPPSRASAFSPHTVGSSLTPTTLYTATAF
jgi:hypothetical protein